MSALAKSAREALKSKARRLAGEKETKVDSTSVKRPAAFTAEGKMGKAPINPRAYKRGGGVGNSEGGGNWIKDAIKKPGALRKSLGVKEGEKIPEKKLEKAEHSKNPTTAKRARLAETLKGMRKGKASGGYTGGSLPDPKEGLAAAGASVSEKSTGFGKAQKASYAREEGYNTADRRAGKMCGGRAKKNLGGVLEVLSPAYGVARALQRGGKDEERDAAEQAKGMAMANAMRKNGGKIGKVKDRAGRKAGGGVTVINIGKGASDAPMKTPVPPPVPMPVPAAPPPMQSQMPIQQPGMMPSPAARNAPLALKTGGRVSKVAKSYKDMTAGAGSGEGRLQKTDIAKKRK